MNRCEYKIPYRYVYIYCMLMALSCCIISCNGYSCSFAQNTRSSIPWKMEMLISYQFESIDPTRREIYIFPADDLSGSFVLADIDNKNGEIYTPALWWKLLPDGSLELNDKCGMNQRWVLYNIDNQRYRVIRNGKMVVFIRKPYKRK